MSHLPALPILLPLTLGALLLVVEKRGIGLQRALGFLGVAGLVAAAAQLALSAAEGGIGVYLLGNWEARLGIVLVADRLSALMLLTTALLAGAALLHASAGWDKKAPHFHALFQFQLAGINGAFLTGDLFNLFVFFEVLLIASYGLMLSGGFGPRLRAGVHYVAFNITASTLFLIGLGFLYGLTGALNMGELSHRVSQLAPENVAALKATAGLLVVVFCSKAAIGPLYLWLPEAYSRSPAAVAALFAIMTKVGVYAILRVNTLVFGNDAGDLANMAWTWLLPAAAVTLVLASLGALAARSLRGMAAYLVVASAATLFLAFGMNNAEALGAGLYYLAQSTFVAAALFLIADLVRSQRPEAGDALDRPGALGQRALLGSLFVVAALAVVGLPPLAGFIGKFAILAAVPQAQAVWLWPLILVTSLIAIVALARAGGELFWESPPLAAEAALPLSRRGTASVMLLLGLAAAMSLGAGPLLRYTEAAGAQLLQPGVYADTIRSAAPAPRGDAHATEAQP